MYVRIATFEGLDPDHLDDAIEANRRQVEAGFASPPEGLEGAKEEWMLVDREAGKGVGMTLFETEEDLRRGDEALNAMSPEDVDADARRTSVSFYEVAFRLERG